MKNLMLFCLGGLSACWLFGGSGAQGQTPPVNRQIVYRLLEGSLLLDDCAVCDRLSIPRSLRGSLGLVWIHENPLFTDYEVRDVALAAGGDPGYQVTGHGTFRIGGEVAVVQTMKLELTINGKSLVFTNDARGLERPWPMLAVHLAQTEENPFQFYTLDLMAAPFRELWFSTLSGLTPAHPPPGERRISGGDLISFDGRVVRRNQDLVLPLGFMPMVADMGLEGACAAAGGEILFALAQGGFSESLGTIQQGDVLSDRGKIVWRNQDLTAKFGLMPPAPDLGLDALFRLPDGEIVFSVKTNAFGERFGALGKGDALSNQGRRVKSNQELLAHFHPAAPIKDIGLDAIYLWPHGEIWFSTEEGFQDQQWGPITNGDLLSDQGYLVYRNLELVGAWSPLEDLANFGLDALEIVTDILPAALPPKIVSLQQTPGTQDLWIHWAGPGRVFQVDRAENVLGPYGPVGPIDPDQQFLDTGVAEKKQWFYRIQQW